MHKNFRLPITIAAALALASCANLPSDQKVFSDLDGSYDVVDQFASKYHHLTRIDVQFLPDTSGIAAARIRLADGDLFGDYVFRNCGYPGDRIAHGVANTDTPGSYEVVRCMGSMTGSPVVFIIKSLDGHKLKFQPHDGLLSAIFRQPLYSNTGMMALVNWGPEVFTAFVIQPRE